MILPIWRVTARLSGTLTAMSGTILPIDEANVGHLGALGDDLRARRQALGLSQVDAAELAGVSERWLRDLEHGKATVRLDRLTQLLTALGLELRAELRRPT